MPYEPDTTADPRVAALERALLDVIDQWRCRGSANVVPAEIAAVMAPEILADLDAADHLRGPIEELKGKVPLVLYFGSKEDADGFAAIAKEAFRNPMEIRL